MCVGSVRPSHSHYTTLAFHFQGQKWAPGAPVRRHVRCAGSERGETRNVTFGAPIHARCVVRRGQRGNETEAVPRSRRGMAGQKKDASGGWRSERDANGAANVMFGATNVTPYSPTHYPLLCDSPLACLWCAHARICRRAAHFHAGSWRAAAREVRHDRRTETEGDAD